MENKAMILFAGLILSLSGPSLPAKASLNEDSVPVVSGAEVQERRVDQAALDSQVNAIRKLQELLKKNRGTDQEAQLLFKLGEAQRQAGSMQFRIAYGSSQRKNLKTGVGEYKQYYVHAIATLRELIQRFPHSQDVPRAYFLRARSHSEIGDTNAASHDYLYLVQHYPKSEDAISAYVALADIAMEEGQWAPASEYLRTVEKHPDHPQYPHTLYKQAWCYYNLRDVPRALSYIERNIRYYVENAASRSDEALRENALQDAALFFLEGYEQKLAHFEVEDAYAYLKRLDSGPLFGKVLVRYAKLLRAHGHEEDLAAWKTLVLREESRRPESFDIIVITYEDQLNKREYAALVQTARDLVAHRGPSAPESMKQAEKLLLDGARQLQVLITRNKDADGVTNLTAALAGLYESFTRIVDEKDPRIPKVHYNLAESLFEIGQYAAATEHYRWVVEHGDWSETQQKEGKDSISLQNASLRAIASRYELLRKRGLVPGDLKARSLKGAQPKELDSMLAEWISWIETHVAKTGQMAAPIDNFTFESNRCIYVNGDMKMALARMREFAVKYPKSKYATPSATLVVDTYVASAQWESLQKLSAELLAVNEWKGSEFSRKLYALAADANFKSVEAAYRTGDYKVAISKAEQFLSEYPESKRKEECLAIAGHSALSSKDRSAALGYFDQLLKAVPGTESAASALLAETSIREEQYDYDAAARGYEQYLALPTSITKINESQRQALRKKTLAFAWISGESRRLSSVLKDRNICTIGLSAECERYEVLGYFDKGEPGPEMAAKAFSRARRGPTELRALWAALALEGARHLAFRDRHVAIRLLTKNWQDLDSLARTAVLPAVTVSVPHAIALNRRDIRSVAPLLAKEAYLVRRLEAIREIENAGMDAAKLPWARIRASVINELADLYADTARSIASLRGATPAMGEPFTKKSETLRAKAFQIASSSAIEPEAFDAIAQPYLHADPKRLAMLLPKEPLPKVQPLDAGQLASLDPEGAWDALRARGTRDDKCEDAAKCLTGEWYRSALQKHWSEATYLIQYARDKKLLPSGTLALLRAYTLAGVGAQAEALAELSAARSEVGIRARRNINRLLLEYYQNSLAKDRAGKLLEEMRGEGDSVAQSTRAREAGG